MEGKSEQERYQQLAKKWLDKTITPAEQSEFAAWYNRDQDDPINIPNSFAADEISHKNRILDKINKLIKYEDRKTANSSLPRWFSVAAAVLLILTIPVIYFHLRNKKMKQMAAVHHKPVRNDAVPGGNKAVLTLADGSKIVLTDVKKGMLTRQGKIKLNKVTDDQLVYVAPVATDAAASVTYNTVNTPKGGQFHVVLSDGTKVWLNAASSITFPTAFIKNERRVRITGEVYFEVAKNKALPFRVEAGKQIVEVLGTHFNINAYTDESTIKTTLVEGSVKVSAGGKTVILKPDQQSDVSNAGFAEIGVGTVNTEDVLAWINGDFVYDKADIPFIMRQAARWYNVDIKYEGNIPNRHFTGSISRSVNLSELLKILKYTGVNFSIADQTIIVK
jgi:ferric-dicitrate binding protein FerR (iron transport regulator)